jgi:hypothetical protein|tara:strand:- start:449 stop:1000 length:552 start_codon:yes stop_codon:yes gene_type:complete
MKVDIDFEILIETGMSADDFLYLYLLYKKEYSYLPSLNLKPNLDRLQAEGYIKLGETSDQHFIRQEFIDLFSSDFDQMFAELIGTYPLKVMSPGRGVRVLHAKDPDAKANLKCKLRYKKIIGDRLYKHKKIMKCLNNQLQIERDNLGYLQNLETWINNHTWEKYENLDENDTRETTTRITRSL